MSQPLFDKSVFVKGNHDYLVFLPLPFVSAAFFRSLPPYSEGNFPLEKLIALGFVVFLYLFCFHFSRVAAALHSMFKERDKEGEDFKVLFKEDLHHPWFFVGWAVLRKTDDIFVKGYEAFLLKAYQELSASPVDNDEALRRIQKTSSWRYIVRRRKNSLAESHAKMTASG